MSIERFIEWYPRYRSAFKEDVFKDVYNFLSRPESIWAMVQVSSEGKPALNGVVKELEESFEGLFEFNNPMNRRMIGSMIKEILHDFGYRRKGQRMVSNSQYFTTASCYYFDEKKEEKSITSHFGVLEQGEAHYPERELEETMKVIIDPDAHYSEKRKAVKRLGSIGVAALNSVEVLMNALEDKSLRESAVKALTSIARSANSFNGVSDVAPHFAWLLQDKDSKTRALAAQALGEIGAPGATEAAEALAESLRDETEEVRRAAGWALYEIGHPAFKKASPALVEAVEDEDEEVRVAATRALGVCLPLSAEVLGDILEQKDTEVSRQAAFVLGMGGLFAQGEPVKKLIKTLSTGDTPLKAVSAWALGNIGEASEEVLQALLEALKDQDSQVREKAAWALGKLARETEIKTTPLYELLEDPEAKVRRTAAWALGYPGKSTYDHTSRLMPLLNDKSHQVREKAAWALGKLNTNSSRAVPAVPLLMDALSDEDWGVRKAAAQALGRIGPYARKALTLLARVNEDTKEKEIIRNMAYKSIEEIGKYETACPQEGQENLKKE